MSKTAGSACILMMKHQQLLIYLGKILVKLPSQSLYCPSKINLISDRLRRRANTSIHNQHNPEETHSTVNTNKRRGRHHTTHLRMLTDLQLLQDVDGRLWDHGVLAPLHLG